MQEGENGKAEEKHAACEKAFEQAGWVFPDRKQQFSPYKNGQQDHTCYLGLPPVVL